MTDSAPETLKHIGLVRGYLGMATAELNRRAYVHDQSKLEAPEKETFDRVTGRLAQVEYGSDEYRAALADMKPALDAHYSKNDHHPEHFVGGVRDMNLFQLTEMICDWMAACKRHPGGDIHKSLEINVERFSIPRPLALILKQTVDALEALERA